jgi:ribosomal protein S18 acetylase RimI-like enzyme
LVKQGEAQIRFMAVNTAFQRMGLGKAILRFTEHLGKKKFPNLERIMLHARETSIPFYEANGYRIVESSYLLFGKIQHFLMEKSVSPNSTFIP